MSSRMGLTKEHRSRDDRGSVAIQMRCCSLPCSR